MLLWSSLALAAAVAAGCTGGNKTQAKAQDEAPGEETAQTTPPAAASASDVAASPGMIPVPDASAATVNLAGNLGCGHCTFHAKETCCLAMKTAEGVVYLIEAGDEQEALMDKRYDEPAVLVAGRVSEVDGQKIIYADTVEMR
jgi:hypothetical protein